MQVYTQHQLSDGRMQRDEFGGVQKVNNYPFSDEAQLVYQDGDTERLHGMQIIRVTDTKQNNE